MISAQRAGMEHRPPGIDPRTVARAPLRPTLAGARAFIPLTCSDSSDHG
jgi:hypothetical protein